MTFVDPHDLPVGERLPGWRGRHFHSQSMTFGQWEFDAGATVHEHRHPQEEVWHVVTGELELTVAGETAVLGPGMFAIVPPDTPHAVRALSDGTALAVDHPLRDDA
jgi:quercetin dioxygenase-like cupin family protein